MKFKPGQLVILARPNREADRPYTGYILQLEKVHEDGESWETNPCLDALDDDEYYLTWLESELEPIRDQDGEDETLAWAGKPEEVTA